MDKVKVGVLVAMWISGLLLEWYEKWKSRQ